MIFNPRMLKETARNAGMEVPDDVENFHAAEYPHFFLYMRAQLCRRLPRPSSHWANARIVAAIPDDAIFTTSITDLERAGFE